MKYKQQIQNRLAIVTHLCNNKKNGDFRVLKWVKRVRVWVRASARVRVNVRVRNRVTPRVRNRVILESGIRFPHRCVEITLGLSLHTFRKRVRVSIWVGFKG